MQKVYMAVMKQKVGGTEGIVCGSGGQCAFTTIGGLNKSMRQRLSYECKLAGIGYGDYRELYYIYEITQGVVQIYGKNING